MMEILNEYIRITEQQNHLILNSLDGEIDRETLDSLLADKSRVIKRIDHVKQFLTNEELGEVAIKIEEIKKLDSKNIQDYKQNAQKIRVILDDLKIKKKNFETYRKNL